MSCVLIDARPAQGRVRGWGVYVRRLVPALAALPNAPRLLVALDEAAGEDPWPEPALCERIWARAPNVVAWEQRVLPRLARGSGADLLHCTANTSPCPATLPYVVTVHDTIFLRGMFDGADHIVLSQIASHFYYRYGVGRGARRARLVLTDSEQARGQIIARLGVASARVRTVPLAEPYVVEPVSETNRHQILETLHVEQPYVLGLGAVDPRKNTANLVRAFARLPRAAAAMLVLAGFERLERSNLPALIAELGLSERVRIFGYLPVEQLTALFQGAAAFAYPSRAEGFGLPILQAFTLGVPVVTSPLPALQEIAGQAARFADPEDPRSLCHELMEVLADPNESHRLAYAGYLRTKIFTWEKTAKLTLEAYQTALGR